MCVQDMGGLFIPVCAIQILSVKHFYFVEKPIGESQLMFGWSAHNFFQLNYTSNICTCTSRLQPLRTWQGIFNERMDRVCVCVLIVCMMYVLPMYRMYYICELITFVSVYACLCICMCARSCASVCMHVCMCTRS